MHDSAAGLTSQEIDQIMHMVDDGALDYVAFQTEGFKLVIARDSNGAASDMVAAPPVVVSPAAAQRPKPASVVEGSSAPAAAAPAAPERVAAHDEQMVRAPMTGICYLRPDPSSPPYVTVGDTVASGDTVALVEVMKTFAAVTAPTAGTVTEVLVGDGTEVVLDQPMFVLGRG